MNFGRDDYLFGEDFTDGLDSPAGMTKEEIKAKAHIVNGGEVALTQCPSCRGSGRFRTYSGRDGGACFKCKGKGGISKGQVAAIKGKETKLANQAAWKEEHAPALAYIQKRAAKGSTFYGSFLDKLQSYGTLTENQMAVVYRDMDKDAKFWEAKKAERAAAAPKVDMTAITALFDRATDNDVKRPIFRFDGGEISKAPMTGKNAGSLYVRDGDTYVGKITAGKFHAAYGAPADMADRLMAVAADPTKAAMAYGRRFGRCGICGKGLVDPVSIRAGIGPVCSDNFGLDWRRELAREELAGEKEQELLAQKEGQ